MAKRFVATQCSELKVLNQKCNVDVLAFFLCFHKQFCLLDWLENCLIHLAAVNHKDHRFKFHN
jgi:hypothetical protein